jgi:hypothetical protein
LADKSTLELIATHLGLALSPLAEAVADLDSFKTFLYRLGWEVEDLPPAYTALATRVGEVVTAVEGLGGSPSPDQVAGLIAKIKAVAVAIREIDTAPAGVDGPAFLEDTGERIFEVLLVDYLTQVLPFLARLLELLDVIVYTHHPETATRPGFTEVRFKFAEIPRVIADPGSIPQRVYGWGTPDFLFELFAGHLLGLMLRFDLPAILGRPHPGLAAAYQGPAPPATKEMGVALNVPVLELEVLGELRSVGFTLLELPAEGPALPGLILQPMVPSGVALDVDLGAGLKLSFKAGSDLARKFGVFARPGEIGVRYPFEPGTPPPSAGFGADLTYLPAAPVLFLGSPGGTRLQAGGATAGLHLDLVGTEMEFHAALDVQGLTAILALGDQDGFLASLLGGKDLQVPMPLGIQWSSKSGLTFHGSAGFDVTVAPHLSLGPIVIDELRVALIGRVEQGQAPELQASASASLSGALGPVAFSVQGVGVKLGLVMADGNAGPFDLDAGFLPPTGLGIVVSAGPITGGGFLSFDAANGRYAGAVQLQVYSVALSAVGVLETRMPDGSPGYSFVILVAGQFPPIQLGYGFTLNGAGGLCGIHRTVAVEALRAGVKNHSLDHILFPQDAVRDAPKIISDLRTVFPAAQGRFVFGPMAIIGWGTPTLVEIELGILIELPEPIRIVLLGQVHVTIPRKDLAVVLLQIDVLGILDFGQKLLSVDGVLYDSRVAAFSITGGMACRLSWGEPPSFALSFGGLNPAFQPPPAFPTLDRMAIALGSSDNPRISLQAYFAITSNTLQFGARAELYAAAHGFNVYGWLGFDALITRSPISLTAGLSGGVALRRGTSVLAGVHLEATLTGPRPWRAQGRACLSLLFFDICVPFDHTFGDEGQADVPATDPWPLLQAAIQDARNWTSEAPEGVVAAVSLRALAAAGGPALLDPAGAVTLRQGVLPLNRPLTRFGDVTPVGPDRYAVDAVRLGGDPLPAWSVVRDYFAPAQFAQMSDDEKLSRPSFELMDAGVRLGAAAAACDAPVGTELRYETIIVDTPWDSHGGPPYPIRGVVLGILSGMNAAAFSDPARTGLGSFVTPGTVSGIQLDDQAFVVAGVDDHGPRLEIAAPGPAGAVALALKSHLAEHPEERDRLQVVPLHETEAA